MQLVSLSSITASLRSSGLEDNTHPFVEKGATGERDLQPVMREVGHPPGGGEAVLIVSRGHDATTGEAVLYPVYPGSEALVPLPPVIVDQPGLHNLPHVGEEAGLVEEDEDAGDALHGEEDEDQGDEESEPAPGVLNHSTDSSDADREDQQATDQDRETDQSQQVLA